MIIKYSKVKTPVLNKRFSYHSSTGTFTCFTFSTRCQATLPKFPYLIVTKQKLWGHHVEKCTTQAWKASIRSVWAFCSGACAKRRVQDVKSAIFLNFLIGRSRLNVFLLFIQHQLNKEKECTFRRRKKQTKINYFSNKKQPERICLPCSTSKLLHLVSNANGSEDYDTGNTVSSEDRDLSSTYQTWRPAVYTKQSDKSNIHLQLKIFSTWSATRPYCFCSRSGWYAHHHRRLRQARACQLIKSFDTSQGVRNRSKFAWCIYPYFRRMNHSKIAILCVNGVTKDQRLSHLPSRNTLKR